jgi:hypothetical protein
MSLEQGDDPAVHARARTGRDRQEGISDMTRPLLASTLALALPVAAQAASISPGDTIKSDGNVLDIGTGTFSEVYVPTTKLLLDLAFTYNGPAADLPQFTFGVAGREDFSQATRSFTLDAQAGDLATGSGTLEGIRAHPGDTVWALIDSNGTLEPDQDASVDVTVSATPVPVPASLALLGAGIAGLGLVRRTARG